YHPEYPACPEDADEEQEDFRYHSPELVDSTNVDSVAGPVIVGDPLSVELELWKAPDEDPGSYEEPHYSYYCDYQSPLGCTLRLLPYSLCKSTVHPVNPCMNSSLAFASQPFRFATVLLRPGG